ncbi:hypothetical protein HK099_008091, partial [Clydaea vesicula]
MLINQIYNFNSHTSRKQLKKVTVSNNVNFAVNRNENLNKEFKNLNEEFKNLNSIKFQALNALPDENELKPIKVNAENVKEKFKHFSEPEWYRRKDYLTPRKIEKEFFSHYSPYFKNIKFNKEKVGNSIPKIIHQIWISSEKDVEKPLPNFKQIENCKKINKDFKFVLWTNNNISAINIINKDYFNIWRNSELKYDLPGATDILRYEILYQYGGIYMDIDTVCVKPFTDLLQNDFFVGYEMLNNQGSIDPENPMVANGILGSKKKHFLLHLIKMYFDFKFKVTEKESAWIETGPAFLTRFIEMVKQLFQNYKNFNSNNNIRTLEYTNFYPYHHSEYNSQNLDKGREKRLNSYCYPTQW